MFRREVGAPAENNSTETRISLSGWIILEENIHLYSKIISVLLKNNFFSGRKCHFYLVLVRLAENLPGLALSALQCTNSLSCEEVCAQNQGRLSHCHQHSEPGSLL